MLPCACVVDHPRQCWMYPYHPNHVGSLQLIGLWQSTHDMQRTAIPVSLTQHFYTCLKAAAACNNAAHLSRSRCQPLEFNMLFQPCTQFLHTFGQWELFKPTVDRRADGSIFDHTFQSSLVFFCPRLCRYSSLNSTVLCWTVSCIHLIRILLWTASACQAVLLQQYGQASLGIQRPQRL